MSFLERLPVPKHLSARVWLLTLPSALVSFEKRQGVPKLPPALRLLGVPLIAVGAGLVIWAWREKGTPIKYDGPLSPLARRPSTLGGLVFLAGVGLLLRSVTLLAYSLGLAVAAGNDVISVEEPDPARFVGRGK